MMTSAPELTLKSIQEAKERIKGFVHRTPVLTSSSIDEIVGGGKELYFKCENFQKSGSFKVRGALNSVCFTWIIYGLYRFC